MYYENENIIVDKNTAGNSYIIDVNSGFKAEFNISPQKYLIKIRMEKAKNRLKNTPSSIQEISVSVGYIDEFTFSKAFKKYSGFSPKAYRQMVRTDSHIKK